MEAYTSFIEGDGGSVLRDPPPFPTGAFFLARRQDAVPPRAQSRHRIRSPVHHSTVLVLDGALGIITTTTLRFASGRAGMPWHDHFVLFIGLDHAMRYWDVHADDGRQIG